MKRKNDPDQPTLFALLVQKKLTASHPTSTYPREQVPPSMTQTKVPAWMNGTKNPILSWIKSSSPRLPAYTQLAKVINCGGKQAVGIAAAPTMVEGSAILAQQLAIDFTHDQRLSREEIGALIGDLHQAATDAAQLLMQFHPTE